MLPTEAFEETKASVHTPLKTNLLLALPKVSIVRRNHYIIKFCRGYRLSIAIAYKSDLNANFALAMDKAVRYPFPYTRRDTPRSGSVQAARRGELLRKNQ